MKKKTVVDLFCGAGGLSKGFLDAGYNVVLGVDYDESALKTFQNNHGTATAMKLDLYNHDNITCIVDFLKDNNIENLDVLVGGPPCQGFSYAGKMDINDKRNFLYLAMVKLTEKLKPKAVLLENVLAMIEANGGVGAKRVIDDFEKIGYKMVPKVLFAPEYGIPQIRKRVFFVGLKDSENEFEFPNALLDQEHFVTCEEAISDLPSLQTEEGEILRGETVQEYMLPPQSEYQRKMRKDSSQVYNHIGSVPIEKTRKMIALVPEGKNYLALPDEYRGLYKYHEALTRYHSKKPSLTINTGHIIIGGPPCQAYSVAGRVRDENGMKDDYRNYLFEHYLSVVNRYQPKVFVFENVPGLLSAMSDGTPIIQLIKSGFSSIGYEIVDDVKKYAKVDASDYGVPQNRERLIILGIRKDLCEDVQVILHRFYLEILPKYKSKKKKTVAEAIGDLPKITPIINDEELKSRIGYSKPECHTTWHRARHHSLRDVEIYRMLANDIQSGRNEYVDSKSLSDLYEEKVGAKSPIHRYHVLRADSLFITSINHSNFCSKP